MRNLLVLIVCVVCIGLEPVQAARTAFRLNSDMDLINYYINNPNDYPVCKSELSFMHFDSPVNSTKRQLFDTNMAFVEVGAYGSGNGGFNASKCNSTINLLKGYENAGFTVYGVFLYREEWLVVAGGGGPFGVDRRILSQTDIDTFKNALAASTLNCKNSLKIFQLLGGRVIGELDTARRDNGDSWSRMDSATKTYLEQFDGIGTECHTVDINSTPGRNTLEAQAAMALWAKNLGKESLVFMGGGGASYKDFDTQAGTFNHLWGEMNDVGLDPRSPHLIYLRQGAHRNAVVYDDHLPETDDKKLTYQVKWMIENVRDSGSSGSGDEPTAGLVAHWPLDEGSGTTTTNLAGSSYRAELLNGVAWGSDAERGTYAVFDGTDDRIATTFTYALANTNDFTWAWWAKKEPTSHSSSIMVGNRYGNTGAENLEFIKMMPSKGAFANTASAAGIEDYNYTDIPASSWSHYAMVKSGTSYQWYVDGMAQGAPVTINYNETSPLPFLIGGDDDGSGTKVNEHFEGCIDDVVLYREALTPAEVVDVKNGNYPYAPLVYELIAGWDVWNSAVASTASVFAANIAAAAVTTSEDPTRLWHVTDERGASDDGDWGSFVSIPSASIVTNADYENLELPNAVSGGTITFSITNNGTSDIELNAFHFDAYAFRSKAARTYTLSVLAGSDITPDTIYSSGAQEIAEVSGAWDNGAHDDIDLSLVGLADHILGTGESVQFRLTFSGGAGDGSGGHDLWVDNVGVTGAFLPFIDLPVLELSMSSGNMIFNWSGSGFKMQSRTNLTDGIWQDVPSGDAPPVTNSATDPEGFYRLIEQ